MDPIQDFIISQWDTADEYFDPRWSLFPVEFNNIPINQPDHNTMSSNTPEHSSSSDSRSDTPLETNQNPKSKKRRQRSESSQPDALIRPRKTRTLRAPQETAKVREKGACLMCKRKRKEVCFVSTSRHLPLAFKLTSTVPRWG
jgi:hypothetical protein